VVAIGSSAPAHGDSLRGQLTNLRALLVLSILMTESADHEQILRLAASAASSLGGWRVAGFVIAGTWWPGPEAPAAKSPAAESLAAESPAAAGAGLAGQLRALPGDGGPVTVPGAAWSWAYPLRSITAPGHMIAWAGHEPPAEEQFLAQTLAQQTGVTLSNAQLHARERRTARELAAANAALEETVGTLRRGMLIHERLTKIAVTGEGAAGIAGTLHDLTGLPVAVEDRYGNLSAWAGPGRPDPYPKPSGYDREQLLRRLMTEGRSVRDGDRVAALASPRPGVLGVLALVDPQRRASTTDVMALEHGATVLAVELARLRGLADSELRVRRELVQDLLAGTDDETARQRAEALGYDLGRPHRVIILEVTGHADDDMLYALRRALREQGVTALAGMLGGSVVMLAPDGPIDWETLRKATMAQLGGGQCRLGVGDACPRPSGLPRSLREARLALRLQKASAAAERTSVFAELDVFRMLSSVEDLTDIEHFTDKWLGPLARYDRAKHTDLLNTLSQYLRHGGGHEVTARALSVHRSTLKYRLQRIRELTGYDLTDQETHFNLQLATRAWLTLEAMRD
jgi:sugar diacid utilization regulator